MWSLLQLLEKLFIALDADILVQLAGLLRSLFEAVEHVNRGSEFGDIENAVYAAVVPNPNFLYP